MQACISMAGMSTSGLTKDVDTGMLIGCTADREERTALLAAWSHGVLTNTADSDTACCRALTCPAIQELHRT